MPVSSILVQERTGDRAVISLNDDALKPDPESIAWMMLLHRADRSDGRWAPAAIGLAGAAVARSLGIPVVMDGGSWKPTSADVSSPGRYSDLF
ncbi:MAG: hypothetical protein DLM55_09585 [Acidimicrobiales bacterium]|nr:MAG: hypothetical protein DLM55_09585 [Acidimicrobiales bacterium]